MNKVAIAVQVDGKLICSLDMPEDATEEQAIEIAKADQRTAGYVGSKTVFFPNRILLFLTQ